MVGAKKLCCFQCAIAIPRNKQHFNALHMIAGLQNGSKTLAHLHTLILRQRFFAPKRARHRIPISYFARLLEGLRQAQTAQRCHRRLPIEKGQDSAVGRVAHQKCGFGLATRESTSRPIGCIAEKSLDPIEPEVFSPIHANGCPAQCDLRSRVVDGLCGPIAAFEIARAISLQRPVEGLNELWRRLARACAGLAPSGREAERCEKQALGQKRSAAQGADRHHFWSQIRSIAANARSKQIHKG